MLPFLQYLIALLISSAGLPPPGTPTAAPDGTGIVLTIAAFGLAWTTWGILAARRRPQHPARAVSRFLRTMAVGRVSALAVYWFTTQMLHGRSIAHALDVADWVLVPHLLRLLPFAGLLVLLRTGLHPVGARLRLEPPSLFATLGVELRQAVLPLGPLVPLLIVWDIIFLADPTSWLGAARAVLERLPVAQAMLSLGMLLAAILVMPFMLRALWRARPLEPGPLRTRLESYAQSVRLSSRDILVWPTGGEHMNAAVVGAFPGFRYVFLTDGLVETLGDEEIEAVFAHEAGHARRGHVLLFFGFTAVLVLFSLLPDALGPDVAASVANVDPLVRTIVMVLIWIGVIFGWVSRRFEQEADVFGIDTLRLAPRADGTPHDPGEHPFARALERIAEEAGGIREITGWRHFSIADRVEFVRSYLTDEAVRARYRRSIRLLRGSLLLVVGAFTVLAGARLPRELEAASTIWANARDPEARMLSSLRAASTPGDAGARAREFVHAAHAAELVGHADRALVWLRSAAALAPDDPGVLAAYAQALAKAGRPRGAARAWSDLRALPDAPEHLVEQAEAALAELPSPTD